MQAEIRGSSVRSTLVPISRRAISLGSGRLGAARSVGPSSRSIMRRWSVPRGAPQLSRHRTEPEIGPRRHLLCALGAGPRRRLLRLGRRNARAFRMCCWQSAVYPLPDVQGRGAKSSARALRSARSPIHRPHVFMGTVPRRHRRASEARRSDGFCRPRRNRPCALCCTSARGASLVGSFFNVQIIAVPVSSSPRFLKTAGCSMRTATVAGLRTLASPSATASKPGNQHPKATVRVDLDEWRTVWSRRLRPYLLPQAIRGLYASAVLDPDRKWWLFPK